MKRNIVEEKSFDFSVLIVRFCHTLKTEAKEFEISGQLKKSGTSIGANIAEAIHGQSKRDFLAKMYIAYKEAYESDYRLRLLITSGVYKKYEEKAKLLLEKLTEITKLLASITKTTKENIKKEK